MSVEDLDHPANISTEFSMIPDVGRVKIHSKNVFFCYHINTESLYNTRRLYEHWELLQLYL